MATCADLVNAVNSLNTTIQDVRDNYLKVHDSVENTDVSLAGLLLRIERDLRLKIPATATEPERIYTTIRSLTNIATILENRLPARSYTIESDSRLIEVLQYAADSIAERLAQQVQVQAGASEIPETGISDTTAIDIATDIDTPGLI